MNKRYILELSIANKQESWLFPVRYLAKYISVTEDELGGYTERAALKRAIKLNKETLEKVSGEIYRKPLRDAIRRQTKRLDSLNNK